MIVFINMVKVYCFCIFLIIPPLYLSADDNFIPEDLWVTRENGQPQIIFDFQGNNVTKKNGENGIIEKGIFKIEYVNNVPFLIINWQKGITNKYLMLVNENNFMLLYDRDNVEPLYTLYYCGKIIPHIVWYGQGLYDPNYITASSSLTENNISYPPSNINKIINKAWAEGVSGYGINETVTLVAGQMTRLYISIGYVSYSQPELYTENSRPKKIRVTINEKSIEIMLKDTPAYQTIDISAFDNTFITFTTIQILEVYPGKKYKDTCINSIINHFSQ